MEGLDPLCRSDIRNEFPHVSGLILGCTDIPMKSPEIDESIGISQSDAVDRIVEVKHHSSSDSR